LFLTKYERIRSYNQIQVGFGYNLSEYNFIFDQSLMALMLGLSQSSKVYRAGILYGNSLL
jgi:hypothetical protein